MTNSWAEQRVTQPCYSYSVCAWEKQTGPKQEAWRVTNLLSMGSNGTNSCSCDQRQQEVTHAPTVPKTWRYPGEQARPPRPARSPPRVAEIANEAVDFNEVGHATASQRPHRPPPSLSPRPRRAFSRADSQPLHSQIHWPWRHDSGGQGLLMRPPPEIAQRSSATQPASRPQAPEASGAAAAGAVAFQSLHPETCPDHSQRPKLHRLSTFAAERAFASGTLGPRRPNHVVRISRQPPCAADRTGEGGSGPRRLHPRTRSAPDQTGKKVVGHQCSARDRVGVQDGCMRTGCRGGWWRWWWWW